ncbi:hypothetical protein [Polyangium sorediatum]|uniref:Outer membrane protein beta-barrel domain-containing protein n=1 Tax=Polyangium sorediatum TaxID=889274 RepID=A0ABT6NWW1_9BACT|nr:hypothetical protein [Polyangium sorediatum]MDI1432818.1 hypothetical protein [Polyangium sorediatum]
MTRTMGIAVATFALAAASASTASAQTVMREGTMERRGQIGAPLNAFEIQVDSGYNQAFGPSVPATEGTQATSLGGAGLGAGLGLHYRANPYSSVGINGSYNMQNLARGAELRGATAGIDGVFHASPYSRLDPWVSVGAGYRMLWDQPSGPNNDMFVHGFQLAKAKIGVDIRVSESVALSPTVGGDLSMFLWRNPEGRVSTQTVDTPRLNAFVFAGIAGRFDAGGQRARPVTIVGRR